MSKWKRSLLIDSNNCLATLCPPPQEVPEPLSCAAEPGSPAPCWGWAPPALQNLVLCCFVRHLGQEEQALCGWHPLLAASWRLPGEQRLPAGLCFAPGPPIRLRASTQQGRFPQGGNSELWLCCERRCRPSAVGTVGAVRLLLPSGAFGTSQLK